MSRRRTLAAVAAVVIIVGVPVAAILGGWDVHAWLAAAWRSFRSVSPVYLVPFLALQTMQSLLAGVAWYGILRYGYPSASLSFVGILACNATGVALNNVLPANLGTAVTLLMLVATIKPLTFPGAVGAAAVEKVFWAIAATFVVVYLFVDVGGSFERKFGFVSRHGWATALVVVAVVAVVVVALRLARTKLRKLWADTRQGGRIIGDRRAYLRGVAFPQLLGWCCKVGGLAVMLAAYRIPVTMHTLMSVMGGNSVANLASVTPGGIGVNQAFNVASLHGATGSANAAAVSIGQQLLVTVWSIVLAVLFVILAFGREGGRLVADAYAQARAELRAKPS